MNDTVVAACNKMHEDVMAVSKMNGGEEINWAYFHEGCLTLAGASLIHYCENYKSNFDDNVENSLKEFFVYVREMVNKLEERNAILK
jgi:hypothetical protein